MTNLYLAKYTGSELHTIEMAKLLCERGYEVTIAVQLKAYPLMKIVESLKQNISVIECQKDELKENNFDLIIVQHYPVFDYLSCKYQITCKNMLISKLSVISDYELLPRCVKDADMILAVSEECAESIIKQGIEKNKIDVFKNSVNSTFFENYEDKKNRMLEEGGKIAVISNHVPEEVQALKDILGKRYSIDYIGIQYKPQYVTADLIKQYDLVITIGRTVQQCFALGVPVYVYDYFGGPGYISHSNFEIAEKHNFSGRGFEKKNIIDLKNDILYNYSKNMDDLQWLNGIAREKYSYEKNFDRVYSRLHADKIIECSKYSYSERQRINAYSKCMLNNLVEKSIKSQLYFDKGNGLNEEESIYWNIMENCEIQQEMIIKGKVQGIRFDPADCPCKCQIYSVLVNGKEKLANKEIIGADYDPMCYIDLSDEEKQSDSLEIKLKYCLRRLSDEDVIDYYKMKIVNLDKKLNEKLEIVKSELVTNQRMIAELQREKKEILNSSSWKITEPLRNASALLKKKHDTRE